MSITSLSTLSPTDSQSPHPTFSSGKTMMDSFYRKTVLESGLRVVTEHIPYVRSVSVGVWVTAGSRYEAPNNNGISHLLEHMVFKGTSNRTAEQIAQSLEAVGGQLNAFTSRELTCYYAHILDEYLLIAVDVLADILCNSIFDPGEIEKEKKVVIEEIKNLNDTPDDLIHDLFAKAVWEPHPLSRSILGTEENIKGFTRQDVVQYLEEQYRADRVVIAAAGNVNHDQLVGWVEDKFRFSEAQPDSLTQEGLPPISTKVEVYSRDISQVHLCIGTRTFPFYDPRRYAMLALNTILGGGMSSRLFQNIREKTGIAYSIYSYVDFLRDTGIFGTYAGIDVSQFKKALRLILVEFQKLKSQPLTQEELFRVKSQLKGNLMLGLESTSNRMTRLAKTEIYLNRYFTLDETLAAVERVTEEEVLEVAKELLEPDRLNLTILGPVEEKPVTVDELKV